MVQADEGLVEKLRYLQKEIAEQQKAQIIRDAEIEARKAELKMKLTQIREQEEKLVSLRALLDSAEEHHRRQLILAKTGRQEWFREDPKEPEYRVVVSKQGEVYQMEY